jgi:hypothetical protein
VLPNAARLDAQLAALEAHAPRGRVVSTFETGWYTHGDLRPADRRHGRVPRELAMFAPAIRDTPEITATGAVFAGFNAESAASGVRPPGKARDQRPSRSTQPHRLPLPLADRVSSQSMLLSGWRVADGIPVPARAE